MHPYRIPIWKSAPFIRLLFPIVIGILLQVKLEVNVCYLLVFTFIFLLAYFQFYLLSVYLRYKFRLIQSASLHMVILLIAMILTWNKNNLHEKNHYQHHFKKGNSLLLQAEEPSVARGHSIRVLCAVKAVISNGVSFPASGNLLVYFKKDSNDISLRYGDLFMMNAAMQEINNNGNPGGFDYKLYLTHQQIFNTVFLQSGEYVLLNRNKGNFLKKFIFNLRSFTLHALHKYITKDDKIIGIAEALLIGYKENLDKEVVQAYSNTGLVHIIAISGLHLGLIYIMLLWIFDRLPVIKKSSFLKGALVILSLWIFSLLTGASASVLRSAVMFTCIITGKSFQKKSTIENSLAVSACILLCYNPYFLWDVGFQLSYLAIISILFTQLFFQELILSQHVFINKLWQLISVTLSAQVLTFPICLYYFHQFPNLFFVSNIIAVPLSTVILFAEIILVCLSWLPIVAIYIGKMTNLLIWLMNFSVEWISKLPYSLWDNIYANEYTTIVLYALVISLAYAAIRKSRYYFKFTLLFTLIFVAIHAFATIKASRQKMIIVYNIPKHTAIDFVYHQQYFFKGDTAVEKNILLYKAILKPSRNYFKLNALSNNLSGLSSNQVFWSFFGKRWMLIDDSISLPIFSTKVNIDVLLISNNTPVKLPDIVRSITPALVIFDASNSLWKIAKWKKQCDALLLPYYSVPEKGAYIYTFQ